MTDPTSTDPFDAPEPLDVEPVLPFVVRSGLGEAPLGEAKARAKVLEVHQIWEDLLVDTRHFRSTRDPRVQIGTEVGHRWRFLGIDMGWVPRPMASVLPYVAPMWSEVTTEFLGDFQAPDQTLPLRRDHELFRLDDDGYVACLLPGWGRFATVNDVAYTFDELIAEGKARREGDAVIVPMVDGLRLLVEIDEVGFYAHLVHEGAPLPRTLAEVDYPLLSVGSLVGFVGMLLALVVLMAPPRAQVELVEVPDRILRLVVEAPKPEEDASPVKKKVDPGEGPKAEGDEGKRGKRVADHDKAKGSPKEVQQKTLDRQVAEAAGVLGALADLGMNDGTFGSAQVDSELAGMVGGLHGKAGTQMGSHGLGFRRGGLGGGGEAGAMGDGLGTKGLGTGRTGYGSDGGGGTKGDGQIKGIGGEPLVIGALERSAIDEVIKRHLSQIRYCYQRELQRDASLAGKVVMKFTIAGNGSVASAHVKTSTVGSEAVDRCLTGRFLRMQFPEPKGRGVVIVSYPFLFGS